MKNTKIVVMAAGTVAGAVLMALAVAVVFGMGTGAGGAVLILLTVVVSGGIGFLMGMQHRIRKINQYSYQKGYQDGLSKKTLVIQQPRCSLSIRLPDQAVSQ